MRSYSFLSSPHIFPASGSGRSASHHSVPPPERGRCQWRWPSNPAGTSCTNTSICCANFLGGKNWWRMKCFSNSHWKRGDHQQYMLVSLIHDGYWKWFCFTHLSFGLRGKARSADVTRAHQLVHMQISWTPKNCRKGENHAAILGSEFMFCICFWWGTCHMFSS